VALWDARFLAKSRAYEQLVSSVQNNAAPLRATLDTPSQIRPKRREDFLPPFFHVFGDLMEVRQGTTRACVKKMRLGHLEGRSSALGTRDGGRVGFPR
jgi:hypothetical protein